MSKVVKNITSVFMILVLLGSTLQLSIYKMECLMTGITKVSLDDFQACNKKTDNDCSISENCCCFHQMNLNFDFDSNFSSNVVVQIPVITIQKVQTFTELFPLEINYNCFTNLPPPSGYDLLKIVQVFRL